MDRFYIRCNFGQFEVHARDEWGNTRILGSDTILENAIQRAVGNAGRPLVLELQQVA